MKKTERINDMIRFLNDKKIFSLKSIMSRYGISKSTALRDLQSLEALGMPIYSTSGRHGHYGILENRLLAPILFTTDEINALYFSMQTLSAYQSTPFHLDIEKLKKKFESCISSDRILTLRKMETILNLSAHKSVSECPFLDVILRSAIHMDVCEITYRKGERLKNYYLQFFNISAAFGQWYTTAFNFQTGKPIVLRCDRIRTLCTCDLYQPLAVEQLINESPLIFRDADAIDFTVGISKQAVDLYYKENYPSMNLYYENDSYCIKGFYNPNEENFIAYYFMAYGKSIVSIKPDSLKTAILERIKSVEKYILSI